MFCDFVRYLFLIPSFDKCSLEVILSENILVLECWVQFWVSSYVWIKVNSSSEFSVFENQYSHKVAPLEHLKKLVTDEKDSQENVFLSVY